MIKFYNRKTCSYEEELIAGKKALVWTYESPLGKGLTELIAKRKIFSFLYGKFCDSKMSAKKVKSFIDDFNIDINEAQNKPDEFKSFNGFFTRKLKKSARPFSTDKDILISPGDGRLIAHENIDIDSIVQIKHLTYSLRELINDDKLAEKYQGGTCIILRLCPTDYHRFHFIDSGTVSQNHKVKGHYYSVNPIALERIPKLFCENKREWSILKSDNFKDVLMIEVGATCVGSIIQTYKENSKVEKGAEKGYFKFGGSTTILFFENGSVVLDQDIKKQSSLGFECLVHFGEHIGTKYSK